MRLTGDEPGRVTFWSLVIELVEGLPRFSKAYIVYILGIVVLFAICALVGEAAEKL